MEQRKRQWRNGKRDKQKWKKWSNSNSQIKRTSLWRDQHGEGYLDIVIGILCLMIVFAFALSFLPIFQKKQQLDLFATELVREAEIKGRTDVGDRIQSLKEQTGLNPEIEWECQYYKNHMVQLNDEIQVIVTEKVKLGMFGFRSLPIEIRAKATGRSEIYYK